MNLIKIFFWIFSCGAVAGTENAFTGYKSVRLKGEVPTEFKYLTSLERIVMPSLKLTGPILDYLGNMTALTTLAIADNKFDGSFSTTFVADHPDLANLDVSLNKFTGPIPLDFENLLYLSEVQLSGNEFVGQIPTGLGGSTACKFFEMHDC